MATIDDLNFTLSSDGTYYSVSAKDKDSISGALVIPEEYDGLPVAAVKSNGFSSTRISSIFIPGSVKTVGAYAFYTGICKIESLTISEGVETIGAGAFKSCRVSEVVIPDSVTKIGEEAFGGCEFITSITLSKGCTEISPSMLIDCQRLEELAIPDTVVTIGAYAFSSCVGLKRIVIPSSVETIDKNAFYNCSNLESVAFSEGLKTIGSFGFDSCTTLASVTFPSTLESLGAYSFSYCPALSYVKFEGDSVVAYSNTFSQTDNLSCVYVNEDAYGWGDTLGGKSVVVLSSSGGGEGGGESGGGEGGGEGSGDEGGGGDSGDEGKEEVHSSSEHLLIPMHCGNEEGYVVLIYESGDKVKADVYDSTSRSLVSRLDTPFPVGGISTITHAQSFDVMFFAQPDTRPCKLVRKNKDGGAEGEYEFSFEENEFLPEPIMDWNDNSEHEFKVFPFYGDERVVTESGSNPRKYYPAGSINLGWPKYPINIPFKVVVDHIDKLDADVSGYSYKYGISLHAQFKCDFPEGFVKSWVLDGPSRSLSSLGISDPGRITIVFLGGNDPNIVGAHASCDTYGDCNDYNAMIEDGSTGSTYNGWFSNSFVRLIHWGLPRIVGDVIDVKLCYIKAASNKRINEFESDIYSCISCKDYFTLRNYEPYIYEAEKDMSIGVNPKLSNGYKMTSGVGRDFAMTIDGGASNKKIKPGMIIALKCKSDYTVSGLWSYDEEYLNIQNLVSPPFETLSPLVSKKDMNGNELRPVYGGGLGCSSPLIPLIGKVTVKTDGVWSGVLKLQEIDKNGHCTDIATITSENGSSNTELSREITDRGSSVRLVCARREVAYDVNRTIQGDDMKNLFERVIKSDTGCHWTIKLEYTSNLYFRVKGFKNFSDGVNAYVVTSINGIQRAFSTNSYALGAWCKENGYPRHIGIYQERLVYAGNKTKPTTVWMSKTNSWDDFELGTEASSAITATLATDKYDEIKWLLPNKNGITIGTRYNEFSLGANDGAVTTADNVIATITSNIGSADICAEAFGTAMIMVKAGCKELYRIDYNTLSEEAAGNQISLLASHLFENDPVVDMFSIKAPSNMLFCLHESGKLSSLTYEPDYGVNGWARHEILDGIDSGCVFRRGGKDVLALVVRDGESYVLGELDLSADVWTDDGRSYESSAVTTPLVFDGNRGGYGKQTIISGCDVYIGEESKRFNVRLNGGDWVRVDRGFDEKNEPRAFEHMRVEIPANSGWTDEATVEIRSDAPYPLVVRAIGASGNG